MALSQTEIGQKWMRNRENKNFNSVSFQLVALQKISKKQEKKYKKLKNTIIASFQAKVGWKSPRKGENKNFRSISFHPRRVIENSKKIAKKKSKN